MRGLIVKGIGGFYYVKTDSGIIQAKGRGIFKKQGLLLKVGDIVDVQILPDKDGVIDSVETRKNHFDRPPIANVDAVIIVFSAAQPKPNFSIVDKFLITAEKNDVEPILVMNKSDLISRENADKIRALSELNIVPVSVSYEWESCDILKALELYESQNRKYTKKPGEDLNSILTGILQYKGRVHFEICEPLRVEELRAFENKTNNEYHIAVAKLLDRRINAAYRLFPNNYIAHDMLYGNMKYSSLYSDEQKRAFQRHLTKLDRYDTCDVEKLKEIFLGIYANPVDNRF